MLILTKKRLVRNNIAQLNRGYFWDQEGVSNVKHDELKKKLYKKIFSRNFFEDDHDDDEKKEVNNKLIHIENT
jgi:hypothetical protein